MMLKLDDLIVSAHETLKGALRRMTQNHKGVLFVCDEHLHLIGALSDGDVRRTLLDETLLVAPVSKAMNIDPITATTSEKAKELLRVRTLSVTDVCFEVGFESLGSFSSLFRKCVGDAPINYRRRERESLKRVPGCFIQMDGLKPSDQ